MELLNEIYSCPFFCNECYKHFDTIWECWFCNEQYCNNCFLNHWIPCPMCHIKKSCNTEKCDYCEKVNIIKRKI